MPRAALSHSQRQPSQRETQRSGRTQRRVDYQVDEEEAPTQNYEDDEEPGLDDTDTDLKKRAADLVRLALFQEQRRMPLRRDEISKRIMGSQRTAFKAVFEEAQTILRGTFGMELVELATRAATHDSVSGSTGKSKAQEKAVTQDGGEGAGDRQGVTGFKKKGRFSQSLSRPVSQGSKTYIIRSTLDPVLIERASLTNKRILEAETADAPDDVDGAEPGIRTYGCLIAWNSSDQFSALGIMHVVLALILVSGKVINDMDLRALLRRLRLRPPTQLALPAHSPQRTLTLEAYLLQLQRQGYLDRTYIGAGSGRAGETSQKRSRGRGGGAMEQSGAGDGEDSDVACEWRWGPRAVAEIGEAAVARFIAEFMAERANRVGGPGGRPTGEGDGEASDDEGGGRRERVHREEAQRRLAALLRGVESAAGGDLAGMTA
ncbi:MAGE-domain-containing protein [Russula earlei]|uniref:MAGE-domain-containing protein n=1 Tax=Russula earlei TaxID=71964 RepID=A0ACC0U426_9AGAM|nr:MAGE-domain-containing protein [Russula earlei]